MSATHFSGPVVSPGGFEGSTLAQSKSGGGITDATPGGVSIEISKVGKIVNTQIFVDLEGLSSSTTDLDIIGTGTDPAYLVQMDYATMGQVYAITMTCLEAATGGINDIDLYSATEGTGKFDDASSGLTAAVVITAGSAWTLNEVATATGWGADDKYLYLLGGAAGTAAAYTAGKLVIELWGYQA